MLKEDQEKSNAHCCWEILEGKVGVDVNDLYPLPERELLCLLSASRYWIFSLLAPEIGPDLRELPDVYNYG